MRGVVFAEKVAQPAARVKAADRTAHGNLRIGEPDDSFERETDWVAEEITAGGRLKLNWSLSRMSIDALLQRKCTIRHTSDSAGECEECKSKETLQRRAADSATPSVVPPIVHEVLNASGEPLDRATRSFFEPRFGFDFSKVRVHANSEAAASARSVDALAYTVGQDVVFGAGQYVPGSSAGRRVLAHELTHVLQQSSRASAASVSIHDCPSAEREADRTAETVLSGEASRFEPRHAVGGLQRIPAPPATAIVNVDSMPVEEAVKNIRRLSQQDAIKVLKRWQGAIRAQINSGEGRIRSLMALRAESFSNYLIGGTIEFFGRTELPSDDWKEPWSRLTEAYSTIAKGQIEETRKLLVAASKTAREHWELLDQYLEKTEKGAERSITVLRGLEVAGAVAATVVTGGAAASAGVGLLGTSAAVGVTGGLYGAGQELAGQATEEVIGLRQNIDWGKIGRRLAVDTITNFVGAYAGGALAKYITRYFGSYLSKISESELIELGKALGLKGPLARDAFVTAGQRFFAEFIAGVGTAPLVTAVNVVLNRATGEQGPKTWGEFAQQVAHDMATGAALQLFLGAFTHSYTKLVEGGGGPRGGSKTIAEGRAAAQTKFSPGAEPPGAKVTRLRPPRRAAPAGQPEGKSATVTHLEEYRQSRQAAGKSKPEPPTVPAAQSPPIDVEQTQPVEFQLAAGAESAVPQRAESAAAGIGKEGPVASASRRRAGGRQSETRPLEFERGRRRPSGPEIVKGPTHPSELSLSEHIEQLGDVPTASEKLSTRRKGEKPLTERSLHAAVGRPMERAGIEALKRQSGPEVKVLSNEEFPPDIRRVFKKGKGPDGLSIEKDAVTIEDVTSKSSSEHEAKTKGDAEIVSQLPRFKGLKVFAREIQNASETGQFILSKRRRIK